jgi:N-acetylglucosaminyl-diphospho-decaprenol L-rhamnosyltransferase
MKSICLAILNYNGVHHLQYLLPSLDVACANVANKTDIVVLDNLSTDNDVKWVNDNHPDIQCVVAPKNDYLFSYNEYIGGIDHDVVVILNNDIKVSDSFLQPLLDNLEDPDVFAASSCIYDWEGQEITSGPSDLSQNNGFYGWQFDISRQESCYTLFTSGACMAVDRAKFLALGGFCHLFYPGYCEDLDICFRAWRKGWKSIYEPASVIWHREHASWSASKVSSTDILNLEHSLLFQWSSLPMSKGRLARWFAISKILFGELLKWRFLWASALIKVSIEWAGCARDYRQLKVSDDELEKILAMIKSEVSALSSGGITKNNHIRK